MSEGKNVALVVASQGFQPQEYSDTKLELEKAGMIVSVFSDATPAISAFKKVILNAPTDVRKLDQLAIKDFDAIALVGGPGALNHLDKEFVHVLIQSFAAANKIVAAICISPRILAKAGVLTGRAATGWDDDGGLDAVFEKFDVTRGHAAVVVSGNFVTADGPRAALKFGQAIAHALQRK